MRHILYLFVFVCIPKLSAQVVLNEVCAANLNGPVSQGEREDWIELYNPGPGAVNLGGWFLSDNPSNPQKWVIPAGVSINAGAYRVIYCSGKNINAGVDLHSNFKITQTKHESVLLTRPNGTLADSWTFDIPNQGDHSYGRSPNGGAAWKIFTTPTPGSSNNGASFQAYAPDVQASLEAGFYSNVLNLTLSTDPGYTIRYTTNGAEPTAASTVYSAPISILSTRVVKARAFSASNQILPGFILANTYFINENHSIPVLSLSGDQVATLLNGSQIRPLGSFEYFEDNELKTEAYGFMNEHGNDSWAYPQRGLDWITRDQLGYKDELKHKFFEEKDRTKFQRLILKAAANDNYPSANGGHVRDAYVHTLALHSNMKIDVRTSRFCVVYVNGQYWGVYDLREKTDDADYTDYYYDQGEFDIDYIKTWGNTWEEYGSWNDWYALKDYILNNNMANPANFAYVEDRFNLRSLIDYVILNQHTVCKDWLNWNTAWWRGRNPAGDAKRWRYALWDMDATFGHYVNYTQIPNVNFDADPCDVEDIPFSGDPENHIDILMALFVNPDFKAMYINRYADLLNTTLSCEYMIALLDSMANTIAPEMSRHCARWGGTVNGWNQNVQTIRDFINARCTILDNSIVNCYDVEGPFQLSVKVMPAASPNQVQVNTLTPTAYPYVGEYFGGVNIDLEAKAATGWVFDHWEVMGNSFTPNQLAEAIRLAFAQNGMVTAFFVPAGLCLAPENMVITNNPNQTLQWTAPGGFGSFKVRYRPTGTLTWQNLNVNAPSWSIDTLPGCTAYDVQVQTVCPNGSSGWTSFNFTTTDKLSSFALADVLTCAPGAIVLDATTPGATYLWDDNSTAPSRSVVQSGEYWVRVTLENCVKTDTIIVAQSQATANIQQNLCAGETFELGGTIFDAQHPVGQVILPNAAQFGCDSIVNVTLQFLAVNQTNLSALSCDPAQVGTDTLVLTNYLGCDSLIITATALAAYSQTNLSALSCDPAQVGADTLVLTNYLGCDSLVITATALAAYSQTNFSTLSCDPAQVGADTLILTNYLGCDSLIITATALAAYSQTNLSTLSCDPAQVGTDTLILTNYLGCDSLIITATALEAYSQTNLSARSCDPAQVGTDTLILTNYLGCDSLIITGTALAAYSQTNLSTLSCDPAQVGTDTLVLTNYLGCDSLIITGTALAAYSQTNLSTLSCDPAQVGTDTLVLTNYLGCDSLIITATALAAYSQTNFSTLSCDPAQVGTDTLVLTNYLGCDSLIITATALAAYSQTNLSTLSCDPAQVGTDTLVLTNYLGCDSLIITGTALAAYSQTNLSTLSCDPAQVGTDTLVLTNYLGCDSLIITATALAPQNETHRFDVSCEPAGAGIDTLVLQNQFGCDSIVITEVRYSALDFNASAESPECFGDAAGAIQLDSAWAALLPIQAELQGQPFAWYAGAPLRWENLAPGSYALVLTNTDGCSVTREINIAEAFPLQLDLGLEELSVHPGDSILMAPQANFQPAQASWSPATGVDCPTCMSTVLRPLQSTLYTLTLFDNNGCAASAVLRVSIDKGIRIFVPNVLQYESGQLAEGLTLFAGPEVSKIRTFGLYDRWGNQLFAQNDLLPNVPFQWNGTFRGKPLVPGVIVWACEIETIDGRVEKRSGDITVFR